MATKTFKPGDEVRVYLKRKDFDKDDDNTIANYPNPWDCPLARAINRKFKIDNAQVGAFDMGVTINGEHWSNDDEWGENIARIVGNNLHGGDKTMYYVTLTKK